METRPGLLGTNFVPPLALPLALALAETETFTLTDAATTACTSARHAVLA